MRPLVSYLLSLVALWIICSSLGASQTENAAIITREGADHQLLEESKNAMGIVQIENANTHTADALQSQKKRSLSSFLTRKDQSKKKKKRLLASLLTTRSRGGGEVTENKTKLFTEHNNTNVESSKKKRKSFFSSGSNDTSLDRKRHFLDRISLVSSALLEREKDAVLEDDTEDSAVEPEDAITHQSDLTRPGRHFSVVTTAALPWMTGTAVNPLLRAAYLTRKAQEINQNNTEVGKQHQWVTLVVPWLELPEDQEHLYGQIFRDPNDQEDYMRKWLRENAEMEDASVLLKIRFYPARYHFGLKSIFAMGNILDLIPDSEADVCILEEPEHLNWYRAPGEGWTKKFHYVVGVVHTNYKEYASAHYSGLWTAPAIAVMSSAMVRAYCHKVIKLSDVLQTFAPEKEQTSNVHGVRLEFLTEGMRRSTSSADGVIEETNAGGDGVYFIGKILWAKGLDLMLEMQEYYKQCTGDYFAIDIFGSGPEQKEIMRAYHGRKQTGEGKDSQEEDEEDVLDESTQGPTSIRIIEAAVTMNDQGEPDELTELESSPSTVDEDSSENYSAGEAFSSRAKMRLQKIKEKIKATTESLEFDVPKTFHELRRAPIPARFPGRIDHALLKAEYKVFVNPSVTEVLCTTTAEAIAMGKFAIIPVHPSNTFFLRFPNCLAYRNKLEFVANLRWALTHEPEPLTPELAYEFTWEAATERFIQASAITHKEAKERERLGLSKLDERIEWLHNELGKGIKGDALRKVLGAGPASHQVKYQIAQTSEDADILVGEDDSDDDIENGDEGLSRKFTGSSFAAAIRSTVSNGLPSLFASSVNR